MQQQTGYDASGGSGIRKQRSKAVTAFESFFAETDKKLTPEADPLTVEAVKQLVNELR